MSHNQDTFAPTSFGRMMANLTHAIAVDNERRVQRARAVAANNAATRTAQICKDVEFAEFISAGFVAADLKADFPGAHSRHLNAIWRAKSK